MAHPAELPVVVIEHDAILRFVCEFEWCSNFSPSPMQGFFDVDTLVYYATNEHFFQASKASLRAEHLFIAGQPTPGSAKRAGRACIIRSDWDEVKLAVMLTGLRTKFQPGSYLAGLLLATGSRQLVEGNAWGDYEWGAVQHPGLGFVGQNHLGRLLMQVREELGGRRT